MANPPLTLTQRIFGVFNAQNGALVGFSTSGEGAYQSVLGSTTVAINFPALRLTLSSQNLYAFVIGAAAPGDGGGGDYFVNASSTQGAWLSGSMSGNTLTVSQLFNGTIANGLTLNRGDTGASIGTITGGSGNTWTCSGSANIQGPLIFTCDNSSTFVVGADGARWNLSGLILASLPSNLVPNVDNTFNLGSASFRWAGLWAVNATLSTVSISTTLSVSGTVSTALIPTNDNSVALGATGTSWANLYLGVNHAPVLDVTSGNVGYYARTAAEIAAAVTPTNFSYLPGDVRRQGCVGNGSTDDTAAFNRALSVGGWVFIPSWLNVLCSSGNANFALANTYLQLDGTLTLTATRITAYSLNNIHIVGTGKIVYSATPTASSVPLGWQARGVIEFGGTDGFNGSPIAEAVGFVVRGIEIQGDFNGTPGTIVISPTDQRRCIIVQNAQNVVIESNRIHGSTAEATLLLTTVALPGDFDVSIRGNTYYGNNHDCISQAGIYVYSFRAHNNTMYASHNGIECNAGEFVGNYAFNMVGSGYACGGNGNNIVGSPLIYRDNVSRNNNGNGFDLECATAAIGTLILQNNHSFNDGGFAFNCSFFDTIIMSGNTATGWGRLNVGSAFGAGNSNFVHVEDNHCYGEGVNSNGGFNIGTLSGGQVIYGSGNTTRGVAVAYVNDVSTGLNPKPASTPAFSQVSQHSVTGTTSATVIASCVIPGNAIGRAGGVEISCGGFLTGTAGAKTINVRFGGSIVAQLSIIAATTGIWTARAIIMNSGTNNNQLYTAETVQNNTLNVGSSSISVATSSNVTIDVQVTLGNSADTVTMNTFLVRQINGLIP